jgi:hypothetical protein
VSEPFELRGRKLYQQSERVKLSPGDSAEVNRRQARAMQDAVAKARAEGRLTVADARGELGVLHEVLRQLNVAGSLPVGIRLAPAEREYGLRTKVQAAQRQRRRAEKKARAAGRAPKKSKSRKRRG